MSQIIVPGHLTRLPSVTFNSSTTPIGITLNATGETCFMIGYVILENPVGVSKTISSAGGGAIVWATSTTTFSNGNTTFKVGIQDVSTASSPAQGDGTFDVEASFTGGGGGISGSAVQTSVMTTGTKTVAHGDLIAITFSMTARGGTDSIVIRTSHPGIRNTTMIMPVITANTGGTYANITTQSPNAYIRFDDGTIGWIYGSSFVAQGVTTTTYNSGTGTADEYGNIVNYPFTFKALGIGGVTAISGNAADCELLLYTDPLGTPAVAKTITLDATQIGGTVSAEFSYLFSSPFEMKANTNYAITVRPTTTNNISVYSSDTNTTDGGATGPPNANCYAVRRLNNSGAFSDWNLGTAKTRLVYIWLVGSYVEQGVNQCNGQVGVY
jgi:hypothetical protein